MMNLTVFALEITLCLSISLIVIRLLKPLLMNVLIETCGTQTRAAFWVMFTQLMLYLAPLLIVTFLAPTGPVTDANLMIAFKRTLFLSVLGLFIGLLAVGQVVWRSIVNTFSDPSFKIPNGG